LASLGTSIANVSLPTLVQAFGASFQEVQWVVLAYLLAITTVIVSVGRLGDITGRRSLLLAGILVFTGSSVACGLAPWLWVLTVARGLQGLGAAIMLVLALAFVSETVPRARIGSAMGLLATMSAIGTALGPSLGGLLIAGFGWRAIFLINLPLGALTLFLARRYLPLDQQVRKARRSGFDIIGTVLLALTLAAYTLAATIGRGSFGQLNVILLLASGFGIGLFVLVESRASAPLVRLTIFLDPTLSASLLMITLVTTVLMATLVVGPFYLSRALHLGAAPLGLVLSIGPVVAALTGLPGGRMADRFGSQRMTAFGLLGIAAGSIALSTIQPTLGVVAYILPVVVITAGYSIFQTANNATIMTGVQPDQRGVISGILNLSRNLGLITGASVMGAVFAFASAAGGAKTAHPGAVANGMRVTFLVAATLMLVALAVSAGSQLLARRGRQHVRLRLRAAGPDQTANDEPRPAGAPGSSSAGISPAKEP